jgi:ligand-binding sensor domain-containing protein
MRIWLVIFAIVWYDESFTQNTIPPVGQWREHLPYNSAIDVTAGNSKVYCATPYSLFTVDVTENNIERLSKVSGLSETGISTFHYDETNNKLFIAYSNSNIDILYRNDIINIPDIKRDNINGDKSIYDIYPLNKNYFLSTGLGVIVVDGENYDIRDSWFIGSNGGHVKVNGFSSDALYYYAATEEGLKRSASTVSNPGDHHNWQLLSGLNGLPAGACKDVLTIQNKVIAVKEDSLFILNGLVWNLYYTDSWPMISVNESGNKIQICERLNNGNSRVVIINADGSLFRILQQPGVISFPRKAIIYKDDYWVADQYGGLSKFTSSSFEVYKPDSPEGTSSGEMIVVNGIFYAAAGEVNDDWNYQYNGNGVYKFSDGEWTNFNRFKYPKLDSMLDFITVAIDPTDESIWAGSFGGGLLHIKIDNSFEIFKQNSIIGSTVGDPTSYRVSGLAFDSENNLWISNFGAAQNFLVRKNDGTWKSFTLPFFLSENALSQIVIDDINQKWLISPLGNGLIVYNHGTSIDNINDDKWKIYKSGAGNGNLPSNEVLSVAKDKNGFIWVGTIDGVAVIQCPQEIFTGGCEAVLPIIQQGNFSNFLFKGEEVRSIAVDGADRKWMATKNGVWLISADGEKVIYRFTENNSPLLSNDVKKIAIDGRSGEVYFATLKGICSFRSTATEGSAGNENVLVFPNPVPPGYSGTIAIRGIPDNSIVKITELDGRLVYQLRALGGQATWNGKDYKGRNISSGVYLVLVSDDSRKEKIAAKIIFIAPKVP